MAYQQPEDEFADFQELSNRYQPEVTVRLMIESKLSRRVAHVQQHMY